MTLLWSVLGFVVAVSLLVAVHEYGHFWAARKLGFKVLRFSVGFGPALWRRVVGADRTEYVLAALPLGGYVKLLDEREGPVDAAEVSRAFTRRPPWQRILVLLAGPGFNFAFAILLLWGMLWIVGSPDVRAVVGGVAAGSPAARAGLRADDEIIRLNGADVQGRGDVVLGLIDAMSGDGVTRLAVRSASGAERELELRVDDPAERRALTEPSALMRGVGMRFWSQPVPAQIGRVLPAGPAEQAGLQVGDLITAIDGQPIGDFVAMSEALAVRPNRDVVIRYERGGVSATTTVRTSADLVDGREVGRIRIETPPSAPLPDSMIVHRRFGPVQALGESLQRAWDMTVLQAKMFARMIIGQVSIKNLSGPITIAEYAGDSARSGLTGFVGFLVLISLSLGFLNLLPIPMLDGGQIVYQTIEWIKGSPLSERVQAAGQSVGIALLFLLMGVALFNDLARQFG
ncbi:MAG: RIP metalloprotease RseP [Xanthomonadales bacterium]|nr:RIP metalloprotease RseP [Xanthomonadales bacterium]